MRSTLLTGLMAGLTAALPGPTRAQAPTVTTLPAATPQYRPAYHFTPAAHWMNDPNGLVYYQGTYHLFFQHNPDAITWSPQMHWGHATSKDLVSWQEQPIALYPDSVGTVFSGSAVVDVNNTTGFGTNGQVPLVAIFTQHNPVAQQKGSKSFENQGLAYSLDAGKTWAKYAGNPVLKSPGIPDFRDPKVSWYEAGKKWVMTLATYDRITFYSSPNLKDWTKESEFGEKAGTHGGVWECPDLFPLTLNGKTHWVLLVSVSSGGPHGGSAVQYFVGQFDGHAFTPSGTQTKWVEYGKDDYAGVTWANTGTRRIFLGWMSNLEYSPRAPTAPWRSAMTVPRELGLRQVGADLWLTAQPVPEVSKLVQPGGVTLPNLTVNKELDLSGRLPGLAGTGDRFQLRLSTQQLTDFALVLANGRGEELVIGYDQPANEYYVDRRRAGNVGFSDKFAGRHTAPRRATGRAADLTLLFDASSVEVFADHGLTVLTELFFPNEVFGTVKLRSGTGLVIEELSYARLVADAK